MKHLFTLLFMFVLLSMEAQQLVTPAYSFSRSKTSYITLKNGKKLTGYAKKVHVTKGLIEKIKFEDLASDKSWIEADEIKFMYLPVTGLEKLNQMFDFGTDMQRWDDPAIESDLLKDGYAYYENAMVKVKKKKKPEELLMQLLNPTFSNVVKIYNDPRAGETTSAGVAGIKMVGGDAKSYYVMKGNEPAYKVTKAKYKKEEFSELWDNCGKEFIKLYAEEKVKWTDLSLHAIDYSKCVSK